jgi:hypothetical protein
MSQSQTIVLQGPIELLIFNRETMTLSIDGAEPGYGVITDNIDNHLEFTLDTHALDSLGDPDGQQARVDCNYRGKHLQFNVEVYSFDAQSAVLTTSVPNQGQLINHRQWERTSFDIEQGTLSVEIDVQTMMGKRTFCSNHLDAFSYNVLSFFIDRKEGLVIPGDVVERIAIATNQNIIFQATGKIARIEVSDAERDELFVVIQLDDPNRRQIPDIEPNKRSSDRYKFEGKTDAFVEFVHPFSQCSLVARLVDISNSGIAIAMQGSRLAMPPGLIIENASMQLPMHARLDVSLRVKSVSREMDDSGTLKLSMEFVEPSPRILKEVSAYVQHLLSENLVDATYQDIEDLWPFYFEAKFFYPSKRRQLTPHAEEVKKTLKQLLKHNTPLLKKILYKEDDTIKGHVTAIKVFDHTLMVQHLNALKTTNGAVAKQVIRAITSYFLDARANQSSGNRYVCFYYRPNNFYPKLIFGESARLIDNPEVCWTETYQFCTAKDEQVVATHQGLDIHEATDQDLSNLETFLIQTQDYRIFKLEGLSREMITNMAISDTYKAIGLYRYRRVFVAKNVATGKCVYAVCCYASPGLNFSELTNSIKLYCSHPTYAGNQELIDAVCDTALQSYQDTAIQEPVLLLREDQAVPSSFEMKKSYTLWAIDMPYVRKFKDATEVIFANMKEFVRHQKVS